MDLSVERGTSSAVLDLRLAAVSDVAFSVRFEHHLLSLDRCRLYNVHALLLCHGDIFIPFGR